MNLVTIRSSFSVSADVIEMINLRYFFVGGFALLGLGAGWLAMKVYSVEAPAAWIFSVFAVLFLILAVSCARKPIDEAEPETPRFTPVWFFDGAVLVMALWGLIVVLYLISRFWFHVK